jgi:hypothetical protein
MEAEKVLDRLVRVTLSAAFLLIVLCSTGCMTYIGKDGPYYGKIVEKETRQPLEGVVVVGCWWVASLTGAHTYYDAYETVTDKEGNFKIPGQGIQVLSDLTVPQLFILKVGYEGVLGEWDGNGLPLAWEGDRMVIGLRKLSMKERRRGSIHLPTQAPKKKYKLLIREQNKEMMERGYSKEYMLPEE